MVDSDVLLVKYTMSGQKLVPPYQLVYWDVFNTPDYTGAQSGYFGQLQNITISATTDMSEQDALVTPTSPAGDDLSGNYPNPLVTGIDGYAIDQTISPVSGDVLTFNSDGYVQWQAPPRSEERRVGKECR